MLRRAWTWIGLLLVTAAAVAVMIYVSTSWQDDDPQAAVEEKPAPLTKTPVSVQRIESKPIRIVEKFSGRLEPYESFTLGFEISGRLREFGNSQDAKDNNAPLDEGMRVKKGQVLARLDDRLIKAQVANAEAQLDQANAQLEKADSDYRRGKELQEKGGGLITTEDYETRVTRWKEAKAQKKMAEAMLAQVTRNLEDTRIISPVDGVIAKRHVQVGESIRQHDPIFKIVQVNKVLLIIGVPESKIRMIHPRQTVNIDFIGRDTFGQKWRTRTGRVHQVPETENEVSKLFDVEVVISNTSKNNAPGDLRPGLIALASVEVKELDGYQVPVSSVLFRIERDAETGERREIGYIFSVVDGDNPSAPASSTDDPDKTYIAKRTQLGDWVEQDMTLVLTHLPPEHRNLVVRGQHRLVDGRPVQIVETKKTRSSSNNRQEPLYGPDAEQYDFKHANPNSGPRRAEQPPRD